MNADCYMLGGVSSVCCEPLLQCIIGSEFWMSDLNPEEDFFLTWEIVIFIYVSMTLVFISRLRNSDYSYVAMTFVYIFHL